MGLLTGFDWVGAGPRGFGTKGLDLGLGLDNSDDLTKKTLEALKLLEKEDREVETLKNSKAALAFSTTLGANLILSGTKLSSYISNFKQKLGRQ